MYGTSPGKQKRAKYRLLMVLIVPALTLVKNDVFTNVLMLASVLACGIIEVIRNTSNSTFQPPRFTSVLIFTVFFQILISVLLHKQQNSSENSLNSSDSSDSDFSSWQAIEMSHSYVKSASILHKTKTINSEEISHYHLRTMTIDGDLFFSPSNFDAFPSDLSQNVVSIILVSHNEHEFGNKTIHSIYETTPEAVIKEVIVVDDGSSPPMSHSISHTPPTFRIHLLKERQGLIRAKVMGAQTASEGTILVFLDAHVLPDKYWLQGLLRGLVSDRRSIAAPLIPKLDPNTWIIDRSAVGYKMMFDWSLEFHWFDDGRDEIPCLSGGLYAIERDWFLLSGAYDMGMLQWGGENIEQSIRLWLCGGSINVMRDSMVGHVFRPASPYPVEIEQIKLNQLRAVRRWFDDKSIERYLSTKPSMRGKPVDVTRGAIVEGKMCGNFGDYKKMFRNIFVYKGLIPTAGIILKMPAGSGCLGVSFKRSALGVGKCPANIATETGVETPMLDQPASSNENNSFFVIPLVALSGGRSLGFVGQINGKTRVLHCLSLPDHLPGSMKGKAYWDVELDVLLKNCNDQDISQQVDVLDVYVHSRDEEKQKQENKLLSVSKIRTAAISPEESSFGLVIRSGTLCLTYLPTASATGNLSAFKWTACRVSSSSATPVPYLSSIDDKYSAKHQIFSEHSWVEHTTFREIHLKNRSEGKGPAHPSTTIIEPSRWNSENNRKVMRLFANLNGKVLDEDPAGEEVEHYFEDRDEI
eukprot:GDKJ01059171.1.p1 GENE.GDKJ01059171.1~~GDKJ01059171.1.p1  ORF type:complete len:752 (-),score=131.54 GDKJ01059171.1:87-2342(-)